MLSAPAVVDADRSLPVFVFEVRTRTPQLAGARRRRDVAPDQGGDLGAAQAGAERQRHDRGVAAAAGRRRRGRLPPPSAALGPAGRPHQVERRRVVESGGLAGAPPPARRRAGGRSRAACRPPEAPPLRALDSPGPEHRPRSGNRLLTPIWAFSSWSRAANGPAVSVGRERGLGDVVDGVSSPSCTSLPNGPRGAEALHRARQFPKKPHAHEQARSDLRWIIAVTAVVIAIFGSAWITTNVMITLAGVLREDLHELRDNPHDSG